MIFASLIARLQDRLAKRARYLRLVSEIQSLTSRDLADVRGDRTDMLAQAYREVYGETR
jgi:hypothetical protein